MYNNNISKYAMLTAMIVEQSDGIGILNYLTNYFTQTDYLFKI